jgi:hypothetical protein
VILEVEAFAVLDTVAFEQFVDFHSVPWARVWLANMIIDRVDQAGLAGRDFGRLAKFSLE